MNLLPLTQEKWLNLYKIDNWVFASRKNIADLSSQFSQNNVNPDAVVIVPKMVNGDLLIIKEFRAIANDYVYSFPAGLIDHNEAPVDAAKRELFEETGMKITSVEMVSPPVYSSIGLTDESVVFVFATIEGTLSQTHQEQSENIIPMLLNPQELQQLIKQEGQFANAKISGRLWAIVSMYNMKHG